MNCDWLCPIARQLVAASALTWIEILICFTKIFLYSFRAWTKEGFWDTIHPGLVALLKSSFWYKNKRHLLKFHFFFFTVKNILKNINRAILVLWNYFPTKFDLRKSILSSTHSRFFRPLTMGLARSIFNVYSFVE